MDEEDLSKQQKDLGEPSSYRKVQAFIETFRKRTDTTTGNILAFSFSKWHRYCYFLTLIMGRAEKASANFIVDMERSLEAAKASPGQRPMTPEEIEALNNSFYLWQKLHLEIASFYIFAKVLLDRIADTFGYYFGVKWRGFGSTHNKLTLQFQEICSKIDLQVEPADLRELLSDLRKRIVDYRTRDIEHVSDPRLLHATSWGVDKKRRFLR